MAENDHKLPDSALRAGVLESLFARDAASSPSPCRAPDSQPTRSTTADSLFYKPTLDDRPIFAPPLPRSSVDPRRRCWYAAEQPAMMQTAFSRSRMPGSAAGGAAEANRSRSPASTASIAPLLDTSSRTAVPSTPPSRPSAELVQTSPVRSPSAAVVRNSPLHSASGSSRPSTIRARAVPSPEPLPLEPTGWLDPRALRRSSLTRSPRSPEACTRAAEGEGREAMSPVYHSRDVPAGMGFFEGRCDAPLAEDGMYQALVKVFKELEGSADGDAASAHHEIRRLQDENRRLQDENEQLQLKLLRAERDGARIQDLEDEIASLRQHDDEGSDHVSEVVERRPCHNMLPQSGILRGRRERASTPTKSRRRSTPRKGRRAHSPTASSEVSEEGSTRLRIHFEDDLVEEEEIVQTTVEIESYRTDEDRSDLWYDGYFVECNRCERNIQWKNGVDFSTIVGAPGKSRFAQWQVLCKDCVAKERFAEFGAMEILRRSVLRGNTDILEHNMLRVLGILAHISPTDDVLMRLLNATLASELKLPGRARHASDLEVRSAVIAKADDAYRSMIQLKTAEGGAIMRRPAGASASDSLAEASSKRAVRQPAKRPAAATARKMHRLSLRRPAAATSKKKKPAGSSRKKVRKAMKKLKR